MENCEMIKQVLTDTADLNSEARKTARRDCYGYRVDSSVCG